MTRCCACVAAGALLGVLIVTVTGALLAEYTAVLENRFHR